MEITQQHIIIGLVVLIFIIIIFIIKEWFSLKKLSAESKGMDKDEKAYKEAGKYAKHSQSSYAKHSQSSYAKHSQSSSLLEAKKKVSSKSPEIEKSKPQDSKLETHQEKFLELKPYTPVKFKFLDTKTWKPWYNFKFVPDKTVLINMELLNGMNRLFVAKSKSSGFQYKKKQYLLDEDSKYYIIEAKMYCYDFHEGFTLPIKRKIDVSGIRKEMQKSEVSEIEYSTNPETLQNFMVAKIAEGIMKGAELDSWMKQIRIMLVIALFLTAIHLFLFAQKTGMLSKVTGLI